MIITCIRHKKKWWLKQVAKLEDRNKKREQLKSTIIVLSIF